jgi:DNA-binding NtrC family response regulator
VFPTGRSERFVLDGSRSVVGRGEGCDIGLDFAAVSRKHAEIYRDGPVFALRDLGSRNGTFLNGTRLAHGALGLGDVIRIGECVLLVGSASKTSSSTLTEVAPGFFCGARLVEALAPVVRAAPSSLPIVVVGETGSGKERVARAIHAWSGRSGEFHAINCAALPENLVEAELFGHRKGAFTGAERASEGRLRSADGGTLLLDEVPDLPLAIQAKLLRVLEEGNVVPLGDSKAVPTDVRMVTATQHSLDALVRAGTLRQDLRARLAGLVVELPPLRKRREEIVPLFERFLHIHSGGRPPALESRLAEALCLFEWRDNVRELELVARRLLALHAAEPVLKCSFFDKSNGEAPPASESESGVWFPRRREHDLLRFIGALKRSNGNVKAAAASLGFSRQRAYRLMAGKSAEELMRDQHVGSESKKNLNGGSSGD